MKKEIVLQVRPLHEYSEKIREIAQKRCHSEASDEEVAEACALFLLSPEERSSYFAQQRNASASQVNERHI